MSIIVLQTTWSDGQVLTASALNGNFTDIVSDYNGSITNANISASAAIAETKISFGGTAGQFMQSDGDGTVTWTAVTSRVSYGSLIPGTPAVANDLGINPRVRATTTATRISAYAKTAPTGADMIVRVFNITQNNTVATLTITAGSQSATSTAMTNASLASGDILRYDVTQIGSTVAGSNITVQIDGTE